MSRSFQGHALWVENPTVVKYYDEVIKRDHPDVQLSPISDSKQPYVMVGVVSCSNSRCHTAEPLFDKDGLIYYIQRNDRPWGYDWSDIGKQERAARVRRIEAASLPYHWYTIKYMPPYGMIHRSLTVCSTKCGLVVFRKIERDQQTYNKSET